MFLKVCETRVKEIGKSGNDAFQANEKNMNIFVLLVMVHKSYSQRTTTKIPSVYYLFCKVFAENVYMSFKNIKIYCRTAKYANRTK